MRVISGLARGRKLDAPEGLGTRPTTDRVKESIFNIIQTKLPAKSVLDLFAGSGAMGIEALSRGSLSATFVDLSDNALTIVKKNLESTRLIERANIKKSDVYSFLENNIQKYDIIFLDPPYNKNFLKKIFEKLYIKNIILDNGIIIVESEVGGENLDFEHFMCVKQAKYGKTLVSVYCLLSA